MTTHHKDLCPCGSGKRYKHCHLPIDQANRRRAWVGGIAIVAALVVGVGAWGAVQRWQAGRAAGGAGTPVDSTRATGSAGSAGSAGGDVAGATSPAPSGAFGSLVPGRNSQAPLPVSAAAPMPLAASGALAPGEHPTPWEYDVAKNRHYDPRPGHQHWHNGPPPADTAQAVSSPTVTTIGGGTNPTVSVGSGAAKVTTTTVPVTNAGSTPLAPGENPAPWEYDKAKDRYFDPRDAHRHWHAGPPPPVSQRGN